MNPFKGFANGINIAPSYATDPVSGAIGDIYNNSLTGKLRYCLAIFPSVVWTDLLLPIGALNGSMPLWNYSLSTWESSTNMVIIGDTLQVQDDSPLLIKSGTALLTNTDGKNLELYSGLGNGTGNKGKIVLDAHSAVMDLQNATDPLAGVETELYYNSVSKTFRYYNGSTWRPISDEPIIHINAVDVLSTVLPIGVSPVVDSYTILENDLVLFTNLISGNNLIYQATNVLTSIVWTAQPLFLGTVFPDAPDMVAVISGLSFANQIGIYTGSTWEFALKRRQFNSIDYFEESAVYTSTILNNTTAPLFTVTASGSEYLIIDYSIKRGSARETGLLYIVHDGTTAVVTGNKSVTASTGVTFTATIAVGNLSLNYISDNAGVGGAFKFIVRRWSDSAGGPAGIPSYTGAPILTSPAAGAVGNIQFTDGLVLTSSNFFKIDTSANAINMNGKHLAPLSATITLNDGEAVATTFATYPLTYEFMEFEYSIIRGTNRVKGRLRIVNNGTILNLGEDFVELAPRLIVFSAVVVGSNIEIQYTATANGDTPYLRYAQVRW